MKAAEANIEPPVDEGEANDLLGPEGHGEAAASITDDGERNETE